MSSVDLVSVVPAAVSLPAPSSHGIPDEPTAFAEALVSAQTVGASEGVDQAVDPTFGARQGAPVRGARGDVRLAAWLAANRAATQSADSIDVAPFAAAAQPVTRGRGEASEPAAIPADAARSAEQSIDPNVQLIADIRTIVTRADARGTWSLPLTTTGASDGPERESTAPTDLRIAPVAHRPVVAPVTMPAMPSPGAVGDAVASSPSPHTAPSPTEVPPLPSPEGLAVEPADDLVRLSTRERHDVGWAPSPAQMADPDAVTDALPTGPRGAVDAPITNEKIDQRSGPTRVSASMAAAALQARNGLRVSIPTSISGPDVEAAAAVDVGAQAPAPAPVLKRTPDDGSESTVKSPSTRAREPHVPVTGHLLAMPHTGTISAPGPSMAVDASPLVGAAEGSTEGDLRNQIVQAVKVQWHGSHGDARIRLQPQYLGELTISLRVEQGAVSAHLSASSAEVRQWIEANEALLRQGLAQHDLKLERLVVAKDEPAPSPKREHEAEPRNQQQPKRRGGRATSDATFEVVV